MFKHHYTDAQLRDLLGSDELWDIDQTGDFYAVIPKGFLDASTGIALVRKSDQEDTRVLFPETYMCDVEAYRNSLYVSTRESL